MISTLIVIYVLNIYNLKKDKKLIIIHDHNIYNLKKTCLIYRKNKLGDFVFPAYFFIK